eukprot:15341559-Ditylum_brightwellii.AAC.1
MNTPYGSNFPSNDGSMAAYYSKFNPSLGGEECISTQSKPAASQWSVLTKTNLNFIHKPSIKVNTKANDGDTNVPVAYQNVYDLLSNTATKTPGKKKIFTYQVKTDFPVPKNKGLLI